MKGPPIHVLLANGPVTVRWGRETLPKLSRAGAAVEPDLVQRVQNFKRAGVKHVSAGSPQASDADVAARWAICESAACGLFRRTKRGGTCLHTSCGCRLRTLGAEGLVGPNKLRWADQACPLGFWGPVDPPPQE